MNILLFCLLALTLKYSIAQRLNMETSLASLALKDLLKIFIDINDDTEIIDFGGDVSFSNLLNGGKIPFSVRKSRNVSQFKVGKSAIITFDSLDLLKSFNSEVILTNNYPKSFKFIVFCQQATVEEIAGLQNSMILQYQYFLINEKSSLKLMTFVWYTQLACNVPQLIEVNRFLKATRKWMTRTFTVEKFNNFHGCRLVFGIKFSNPAFMYELQNDGSGFIYEGYHINILFTLEKQLNFSLDFNPQKLKVFKYYKEHLKVDLFVQVQSIAYYPRVYGNFFFTRPYLFESELMAVPPGENLTSYEKMLLPFDEHVWSLIITTFASGFITIMVLQCTRVSVRNFVIGRYVRTPTLNMFAAIFGVAQAVAPGRNFSRFLTITFSLFCLVIRTAYQGKMFEFMQKDMKKTDISSLEELIQKNFTFYVDATFFKENDKDMDLIKQ